MHVHSTTYCTPKSAGVDSRENYRNCSYTQSRCTMGENSSDNLPYHHPDDHHSSGGLRMALTGANAEDAAGNDNNSELGRHISYDSEYSESACLFLLHTAQVLEELVLVDRSALSEGR